ncbi:2'-5' RNA ligase [Clostridium sp. YIM B02505]|uniref:2'-5' RNA ligase n=1 Tax=Clostridium yunnanense TaxID=2800325 RepID=A0ABS1EKJ9_9CLOT|nr:2'-5' RNA ligase [Clostridium yunnanense]MBK1809891.1 2'-5' RNA ligase [Clostridium yunnanense]
MEDKILCVLAQYDEETQQKLKDIQQVLLENGFVGRQTADVPYHMTLGTFKLSDEEMLREKVKSVSKNFRGFDIRLNNIGLFGLDVLFIAPLVNYDLLNLQKFFSDDNGWTAHTTLLIDDHEVIHKALPIVAENFKSFEGRVESISLYEFWPTRLMLEENLL